jgi:hypothetical protein
MNEIVNELLGFVKENYVSIAIIVTIFFALLIIISIKEWNLDPPKPESRLVQEVTVETFDKLLSENKPLSLDNLGEQNNIIKEIDDLKLSPSDGFCQSHLGKSAKLELSCEQLTQDGCGQTKCCVWGQAGNKGRCMAGDKNGPIYSDNLKKDKDGNLLTMDAYYYQGKKFGVASL